MPPRRAQRSAASRAAQEVVGTPSSRSRVTRGAQAKQEVDTDQDEDAIGEDDDDVVMEVEAGPSRRSRAVKSRAQPSRSRNTRGRAAPVEEDEDAEGEDVDEDEEEDLPPPTPSKRTRTRKSVSYKEIPVEVEEDAEGEDDEDAEGEDDDGDEEEDTVPVRRPSRAASTPGKTRQTGEEKPAKPVFEKIGTGRGGFSVKGAAAAAARARWAKVRAERAERGEDWDERPKRKSGASGARNRPTKASDETTEIGSTFSIKGQVYEVGDDELILPDNEKGEAKVDALGRLQGGREYKVVTFTSDTRRNSERVYALTIDAARACGYTDSLAFLRRCPQLIKLACNNSERDLLIDMGRVSGNLRNRTVTMVAMRNVFKLMGARVVKNGKWVTDDYDEEEALVKCAENNFTPYGMAHEEEIMANAISTLNPPGRPSTATAGLGVEAAYFASRQNVSFTPFYTLGGPTTHFGGNGLDPFSGAGWGNKRARMRTIGTDEENWMLKLAEESRMMDARLREFRQERLVELEGEDATRGWVYALERTTEEDVNDGRGNLDTLRIPGLQPPTMERKRSGLSREVSLPFKDLDDGEDDALTPLPQEAGDDDAMAGSEGGLDQSAIKDYTTPGGRIIVQSEQEAIRDQSRYNWGLGSWTAGTIKAAYEPHTQMPHIPQYTQPQLWTREQTSVYPVLSSLSDPSRRNFVQSTVTGPAAQGLASVEYVFEPQAYFDQSTGDPPDGTKRRLDIIEDALEWERQSRRKQRQ